MVTFLLFKKTGSKSWQGVSKVRAGVKPSQVKSFLGKFKRPGITTRLVNQSELNKVIRSQSLKVSNLRKKRVKRKRR